MVNVNTVGQQGDWYRGILISLGLSSAVKPLSVVTVTASRSTSGLVAGRVGESIATWISNVDNEGAVGFRQPLAASATVSSAIVGKG